MARVERPPASGDHGRWGHDDKWRYSERQRSHGTGWDHSTWRNHDLQRNHEFWWDHDLQRNHEFWWTTVVGGSAASGGIAVSGGSTAQGGSTASGGSMGQGANATGGRVATGGIMGSGGRATTTATGGAKATGGTVATGGSSSGSSNPDGGLASNTGDWHCVNWSDPGDNYQTGNIQPTGLSATTDTYDTALATANAILSGFQTVLKANSIRVGINEPRCQVPGGRRATRPSSTQPPARTSKVILGYWAHHNGKPDDVTAFNTMWQTVITPTVTTP